MRNSTRILIAVFLSASIPAAALADLVDDGMAALSSGDYARALRLFRVAAAQGDDWAQDNLGLMYHAGEGVAKDDAEAVRLFRLSAAQGNSHAQAHLGMRYERGEGVPADKAEALRWYRLSAAQGNSIAAEAIERLTKGN